MSQYFSGHNSFSCVLFLYFFFFFFLFFFCVCVFQEKNLCAGCLPFKLASEFFFSTQSSYTNFDNFLYANSWETMIVFEVYSTFEACYKRFFKKIKEIDFNLKKRTISWTCAYQRYKGVLKEVNFKLSKKEFICCTYEFFNIVYSHTIIHYFLKKILSLMNMK